MRLTILDIDGEPALVFPPELLARLKVGEGEFLTIVESDQGLLVSKSEPDPSETLFSAEA